MFNKNYLEANKKEKLSQDELNEIKIKKEKKRRNRKLKNLKRKALRKSKIVPLTKEEVRKNILLSLFPEKYQNEFQEAV